MAENEIAIVAILQPAPGKLKRLRELIVDGIAYVQANEPGTLEFSMFEQQSATSPEDDDQTKLFLIERYASQAALDKHESSANYAKVFQIMTEEKLLEGEIVRSHGPGVAVFRR